MNDVLVAIATLVSALIVEVLAELKGHALPSLERVVARGATVHAGVFKQEVATGHAFGCVSWRGTAAQTLVMTALLVGGTGTMLAFGRAH